MPAIKDRGGLHKTHRAAGGRPTQEAQQVSGEKQVLGTSPEGRAQSLVRDFQAGRLSGQQLMDRANEVAGELRGGIDGRRDAEQFYRTLAATPGLSSAVVGPGGQCYQSGNISAETPTDRLQIPLNQVFSNAAERERFEGKIEEKLQMSITSPPDLNIVSQYLDRVSRDGGPEAMRQELGNYLTNYYTHGNSVGYHPPGSDWTRNEPQVGDIQADTLRDGAGRMVIDCDGYAAVARGLLQGVDGGRYNFDWGYTSGPGGAHMLGGVTDTRTGQGFVIDNNQVAATYTRAAGETNEVAARRGMTDSLRRFHTGQNITANGLGIAPGYTQAVNSRQPVAD
jgi:hypothetical protein